MSKPVLVCQNVSKSYSDAGSMVDVLRSVSFEVCQGEMVAIVGSSGSGKSTLLHLLGGLDRSTSGKVVIAGQDIALLTESARSRMRNQSLGFIYQFHHLLPEFTALENVCMPFLIRGAHFKKIVPKAEKLLDAVGLANRITHRPSELSGGERQRVAIARALVTEPICILADEPTGNLDPLNASVILNLFVSLQKKCGTAVVLVTHDMAVAERGQRLLRLQNGQLNLGTMQPC